MSEHILAIDTSEIRPGKLEELKTAIGDLAAFVETNEPRPLAYHVYLDPGGTRMTVVQVHPDSASMEHHMAVAGPAFRPFAELLTLRTMDVYGRPSEALMRQIREKVAMLGDATVAVYERQAGFERFGPTGAQM